jgi:protein NrfD
MMIESSMNFTLGLSEGIAWPWPIAVYLFLAGISGGSIAVAILLNMFKGKSNENTPLIKAASVLGLVTILLGMVCLVLDLTNPLFFWRILVYYNPTSVMSLGVMALLFYIPLVFVLTMVVLNDELKCCGFLKGLSDWFAGFRGPLLWIVLVLALTICAYTGFLISALIRFPLINQAVLPALRCVRFVRRCRRFEDDGRRHVRRQHRKSRHAHSA